MFCCVAGWQAGLPLGLGVAYTFSVTWDVEVTIINATLSGTHKQLGPATAADIKAEKPKTVAVVLPAGAGTVKKNLSLPHRPHGHIPTSHHTITGEDALAAVAEDLLSGLYVDNRFKTGDGVEKPPQADAVAFYGVEAGAGAAAALKQARAFAEVSGL